MVRDESARSNEMILEDLRIAEEKLDELIFRLEEEFFNADRDYREAVIAQKPEGIIYPLQDKVTELKEKLGNAQREKYRIIQEKDKISIEPTDNIEKFPPHQ